MRRDSAVISDNADKKLIKRLSPASLMSVAKWRRLLAALDQNPNLAEFAHVKLIGGDELHSTRLGNWWLVEPKYVDGTPIGPIPLLAIERVEWWRTVKPAPFEKIPAAWRNQDIQGLADLIGSLGKYPIELTDDVLTLTAHDFGRAARS